MKKNDMKKKYMRNNYMKKLMMVLACLGVMVSGCGGTENQQTDINEQREEVKENEEQSVGYEESKKEGIGSHLSEIENLNGELQKNTEELLEKAESFFEELK